MKRREDELVGSVIDRALSSFTHPIIRRVMADRLRNGEPVEVQGWRLGAHRPSAVGLYDTVFLHPDDGKVSTPSGTRRTEQKGNTQ